MAGRRPDEPHRAATPLELLFDLTLVIAFSIAGNEAAHLVAEGHFAAALGGFGFAMSAVVWAWMNFTWFSSAFDTDDWLYRVLVMVQMVGVVIVALGLPAMFHSLDAGGVFENGVMVAGYVVMRVGLVALWMRVAVQDPRHRRTALVSAGVVTVAQIGWICALLLRETSLVIPVLVLTIALDVGAPLIAARWGGPTPWHPHHIAERYGLLTIITFGEVIFGTVATVSAVIDSEGWSAEAIALVFGGIALALAMWWCYFSIPVAEALQAHRDRAGAWAAVHIAVFASIAATGAGLHVAGYVLEHEAHVPLTVAVWATAIPVLVFLLALAAIYSLLLRAVDLLHVILCALAIFFLLVAVVLSHYGASFGMSGLFILLAPVTVIVGLETVGHRHLAQARARL